MMDTWESVAGQACQICEGPATHYYGQLLICCQCHGGELISADEAAAEHQKAMAVDTDFERQMGAHSGTQPEPAPALFYKLIEPHADGCQERRMFDASGLSITMITLVCPALTVIPQPSYEGNEYGDEGPGGIRWDLWLCTTANCDAAAHVNSSRFADLVSNSISIDQDRRNLPSVKPTSGQKGT